MGEYKDDEALEERTSLKDVVFVWLSHVGDALLCIIKAVVVVGMLVVIGKHAAALPTILLPFVFLLYAVPTTLGAMYGIYVRRLHNQSRYNEGGELSRRNRSWLGWMALLSFLSLVSAFMFVLEAPNWDEAVWSLFWIAIPAYYVVFLIARFAGRRQYSPTFYKSRAILWSTLAVTGVLCVVYAAMTTDFSPAGGLYLEDVLQNRYLPFAGSHCDVLIEADKLNTYSDALTKYGLSYIAGGSFAGALLINVLLSASIFWGFANQLSFCVLSKQEIKAEFQLLPAAIDGGDEGDAWSTGRAERAEDARPIRKRYFVVALAVWVALSAVFATAEVAIQEVKKTDEWTHTDEFLEQATAAIVLAPKYDPDDLLDIVVDEEAEEALADAYAEAMERLATEEEAELTRRINAYYDSCLNNVSSYVEWRDGFAGVFANVFKPVGEGMARDEFVERVVNPVDRSEVDKAYDAYISGLVDARNAYLSSWQSLNPNSLLGEFAIGREAFEAPDKLELWPSWEGDASSVVVRDVLLGSVGASDKDLIRDKVEDYIEERRAKTLLTVSLAKSEIELKLSDVRHDPQARS